MKAAVTDMSTAIKFVILSVCICINVLALSTLLWGNQSIGAWQEARLRYSSLESQLEATNKQNAFLSKEIRLLQADPAYLEKRIRQQLNYVRKGEILYIFEQNEGNPYWAGADGNE